MEAESCVNFSLLFYRFASMLFGCVIIPIVVIDELAYQGLTDLCFNRTSLSNTGTAIITELDFLKVNASLPVLQELEQVHALSIDDVLDIHFFSWSECLSASLSQTVCLVIMAAMIFMMFQQREQVFSLQKELSYIRNENNTKMSVLQQIQLTLENQQSQFTSTTYKMTAMNKRIDKVSSELDDENTDLETMYKCLEEWKDDWKSESAKIRQINPDYLAKLPTQKQSDIDSMAQDQQQQIRKYISHAEIQFEKIFRYLKQDNAAITNVFDDLDYIHDVLK